MTKVFKNIGYCISAAVAACVVSSFLFSVIRQMPFKGPTCEKLQIDRLEPVISTRWFCPVSP